MKMRTTIRSAVLISAVLGVLVSGAAMAVDFSATVMISRGIKGKPIGPAQVLEKIYASGNKTREEQMGGQGQQVMINRPDKGVIWVIMPGSKSYMEMPSAYQANMFRGAEAKIKKMAGIKLVGTEKLNGYTCRKYMVTRLQPSIDKQGKPGKSAPVTITFWYADKLDSLIKIGKEGTVQTAGGNQDRTQVIEFKDIKEGRQAASLFELPKGYKKMQPKMPTSPQKPLGTHK